MHIELSKDFGYGEATKYKITAKVASAQLEEGYFSIKDVEEILIPLFSDFLNYKTYYQSEYVQVLIDLGLIDEDMIRDWVKDQEEANGN